MIAANYQSVKKDFEDFYEKVADKNETVVVSKDGGNDIVNLCSYNISEHGLPCTTA